MNENVNRLFEKVKAAAIVASDRASEVFDATGKRAGEIWNTTRLSIEVANLENEISNIYRALGALVYQAHVNPNGQPEGVDEKLAQIDGKKQKIAELRGQIENMKPNRRCPNEECGATVGKTDSYCRCCGQSLDFGSECDGDCCGGAEETCCCCEDDCCCEEEACCEDSCCCENDTCCENDACCEAEESCGESCCCDDDACSESKCDCGGAGE